MSKTLRAVHVRYKLCTFFSRPLQNICILENVSNCGLFFVFLALQIVLEQVLRPIKGQNEIRRFSRLRPWRRRVVIA